ncbi:macrophage mannose receptor 1 [Parasteatoda tepidariorum]|uniref:macrophage mannose receptor 1 n=1 Tax=Parasteatoda tepidariorum TaxID=114398 RepID=UPI00077FBA1B|nr:macrophage mannose receptor 1 [Parasteatoda tepidariorum]
MAFEHVSLIFGILLCFPVIYSSVILDGIEYCQLYNPPWVKYKGYCYLFHQDWKTRVSFYDAEDECRGRGGHLASIHSEDENNFFVRMANSGVFRGRQWIGLNILKGNTTPEWTDGTPVNYTKIVPKDFYKNEKCFIFMRDKKGWRPEDCGLHYSAVCKRPEDVTPTTIAPPTTIPPPSGYCPKDWIQFGQKCYKFFGKLEEDRVSFKQARDACWSLGKGNDLVSIHSMEEQAFITQHLYDFGSSVWIGIQKVESDEIGHDIVFGWIDNSRSDFKNWASGHPIPGTWKYCGRLSYEEVAKGEWISDYCDVSKRGYICQRESDPSLPKPDPEPSKCNKNSVGYRNSCYRYFPTPETQVKAEKSCQTLGGHLVSIQDGFEQSFLHNFIPKSQSVWTGLSSIKGTWYFRWSDKQPVYYFNWVDGQSVLNTTKPFCAYLDGRNVLKWKTADCSTELPYVCEITDDIAPSFPEVIGTCDSTESTWVDIGDEFCYHVGKDKNHILSWDSGLRYCLSKGMKMITTYSPHQINSIIAYLWNGSYPINIGMIRKFDKKSFMWVDGSTLEFLNWDEKEPSDYPEDRGCVAISQSTGKWRTVPCNSGGLTVCQAPKVQK